jgi:hypothetical protein
MSAFRAVIKRLIKQRTIPTKPRRTFSARDFTVVGLFLAKMETLDLRARRHFVLRQRAVHHCHV